MKNDKILSFNETIGLKKMIDKTIQSLQKEIKLGLNIQINSMTLKELNQLCDVDTLNTYLCQVILLRIMVFFDSNMNVNRSANDFGLLITEINLTISKLLPIFQITDDSTFFIKLHNIVVYLLYYREKVSAIQKDTSLLQYFIKIDFNIRNNVSSTINLRMLDVSQPYGYQIIDPSLRLYLSPLTDKYLHALFISFNKKLFTLYKSKYDTNEYTIIKEFSNVIGYCLYSYDCNNSTSISEIDVYLSLMINGNYAVSFQYIDALSKTVSNYLLSCLYNISLANSIPYRITLSKMSFDTKPVGYASLSSTSQRLSHLLSKNFVILDCLKPDQSILIQLFFTSFGFNSSNKTLAKITKIFEYLRKLNNTLTGCFFKKNFLFNFLWRSGKAIFEY